MTYVKRFQVQRCDAKDSCAGSRCLEAASVSVRSSSLRRPVAPAVANEFSPAPRDTHASLLGKHGVPLEVISWRLGHATIGITAERYLHVYKERDAETAAAFEQLAS
jgi:site-specific recombinase XerD